MSATDGRRAPCRIGEPLRTVIVEPLELPVENPERDPETQPPAPQAEPEKVPVAP